MINESTYYENKYRIKGNVPISLINIDYYATVDTNYINEFYISGSVRSYSWFFIDSIHSDFEYCFGFNTDCNTNKKLTFKLPTECKIDGSTGANWNPYKVEC